MKKKIFNKGQHFGNWVLDNYLGGGGNGEVWKCINSNGNMGAIKLLKSVNPKSYARFLDETAVIENNSDIIGIVPMIDKHLPDILKNEVPFFVMPIAESAENNLRGKTIEEKIDAILEISETLSKLHSRGISHRDLKPANFLVYNSRFSIADFGLVDYPDKKDISFKGEEIGAKWTIAPEMRRDSSNADGLKADMYSLAKTLWIILTENTKGFDGQYSTGSIIELKRFYKASYMTPIDNLLTICTNNDPLCRPSIDEFISKLNSWKTLNDDFHKRNIEQWFEIQIKLFPTAFPKRVIWEDVKDIVNILKIVCSYEDLNHMFFPNGGGLDLEDVRLSHEKGCIELDFQLIDIVKPHRLVFESFGFEHEWNYFRLELSNLEPTNLNDYDEMNTNHELEDGHEDISELSPGSYYPYDILSKQYYYKNDYLITEFSRHVTRWFNGCFVIFCKRSTYNLNNSTYDGRHNKMSTDEFRNYIQLNIDRIKKKHDTSSENKIVDKEVIVEGQKREHAIKEQIVYRCGWCGNIVDAKGYTLHDFERDYNIAVIEKFGDRAVIAIDGKCCTRNN